MALTGPQATIAGAGISAGGGLLGSTIGGISARRRQRDAMVFNMMEADGS